MSTKYIASNWRLLNQENSNKNDNYGLSFDGTEFIDCGDSDLLSFGDSSNDYPFSISAWINMDNASNFRIVSKYDAPNYEYQFDVNSSNKLQFYIFDGSSYRGVGYDTALNTGEWYHVAATYDGSGSSSGMTLYVNGLAVNDTTFSNGSYTAMHNTSATVKIGRIASSYAYGKISEVAVFDYALSESQISTLYGSSSLGAGNPMALKPQPVAYYPLGDNSASNPLTQPNEAVEDASVFDFDGSNNYIDCGTIPSFDDGDISFALWCNLTSNGTFQYILSSTNSGSISGINIAVNSSGNLVFQRAQDVANTQNNTGYAVTGFSYGNWHHLCGTYNATSGELKAYVDGVLKSTTNDTADARSASTALKIGGLSASSLYPANGQISNTQIWNTELSASEVTTLYNSGVPLTGTQPQASNLRAWYKLDQSANWDVSGSGNWTIPDASGNGNDGTSSNMTSANLVLSDLTRAVPDDSYSFNFDAASTDYIQTTSNSLFNGLTAFSISCWIKTNGTQLDYTTIFGYQSSTSQYVKLAFYPSEKDRIRVVIRPGTTNPVYVKSSAGSIVDGEWVHIVAIGDANNLSNLNLYINGILDNDVTQGNITTLAQSSDIYIGTDAGAITTREFNGKISNISVFNEALTSTEVLKLYANGVPQNLSTFTPQPVAWYPLGSNSFWNGSQWTVRDMIGSNDGTGQNIGVDGLVGDSPRSTAGGTGTNMDIESNIVLSTKWSENNSISINMSSEARVTDVP